jgi:hypothetical protein
MKEDELSDKNSTDLLQSPFDRSAPCDMCGLGNDSFRGDAVATVLLPVQLRRVLYHRQPMNATNGRG